VSAVPGDRPRRPRRPYKVSVWPVQSGTLWPRLRWAWECGRCKPATRGGTGSLRRTLANVARHCGRYDCHHAHVARTRGWD
jgi:hypothetical protein